MNLTTARDWIRSSARQAGDPTAYGADRIDRALITVCCRFHQKTRAVLQRSTLALTSGSPDLPALPAGFAPEQLLSAYLNDTDESDVDKVSFAQLRADRRCAPTASGTPCLLAFDSLTTGQVYPTPDADLALYLWWWRDFQDGALWAPGQSDGSLALSTPDTWLPTILQYGAPAVLQHTEPEQEYAGPAWKAYLDFERDMIGRTSGLGSKIIQRKRAR